MHEKCLYSRPLPDQDTLEMILHQVDDFPVSHPHKRTVKLSSKLLGHTSRLCSADQMVYLNLVQGLHSQNPNEPSVARIQSLKSAPAHAE
jgi:hypothetical protein